MRRAHALAGFVLGVAAAAAGRAVSAQTPTPTCPLEGDARIAWVRALNVLKNRVVPPAGADLDPRITLHAIVTPGDDTNRWDPAMAVEIVGYVRAVKAGGIESCNCRSRTLPGRDSHIEIVLPASTAKLPVIVEVTPRWRRVMARRGRDWSTAALRGELVGHWVRVRGWMMFDAEHSDESENTAPGRAANWRQTAWEIHPITDLEVVRPPATPTKAPH